MPTFQQRSTIAAPADELFAWHVRPGALERLTPPWEQVRVVERDGGVEDGGTVVLELRRGPVRRRWVARHRDFEPGRRFVDEQVEGPFARWQHRHTVEPAGDAASVLEDAIDFALPFGPLGTLAAGPVERTLRRTFRFRHERVAADLERHSAAAQRPLRIAVTGASGLIGAELVPFLTTGGHRVEPLVRCAPRPGEIRWDPERGALDARALEGFDAVVHLSGEPIAQRWTAARKDEILRSRTQSTRLLAETLQQLERPPKVFLSGSAIGVYGGRGDEELTEASEPGGGFLAEVCRAWEEAAAPAAAAGIRVVSLRTGIVLSPKGGALAKMLPPFRLGAGGPVGSGRQWWSWIGLDDAVGAIHHLLLADGVAGPVNLTAPAPATSREFARALGRVLRRPAVTPLPAPVVSALFGEMGRTTLLEGQRALPAKLEASGFRFRQPELEGALRAELGR